MTDIYDRIPELRNKPFSQMYESPKRLIEYKGDYARDVIELILAHLAQFAGGYSHLWAPADKEIALIGWTNSLKFMNARQLFNALEQVLKGNFQRNGAISVPNRPVDFHALAMNGSHNRLPPSISETKKLLPGPTVGKDYCRGEEAIAKIRAAFKNPEPMEEEERQRQYDSVRSKEVNFCNIHDISFYYDLGCPPCRGRTI
jgi:hypothetical protein